MMKTRVLTLALLSLAPLLAGCSESVSLDHPPKPNVERVTGDAPGPREPATTTERPLRRELLQQVAVVGASMSDGFQLPKNLADVLDVMIRADHEPTLKSATMFFFTNPLETGPGELEMVSFEDPTLLVGVDFLFWYGYGTLNADGQALTSEAERLGLLESGLELFDEYEVPAILGDFPDMSDAIGTMLEESQVPSPEMLQRLNQRLYAWAKERPNVEIIPLARAVAALRADEPFEIGRLSYPGGSATRLLQDDQLHPTLEGLTVIAHLVGLSMMDLGIALEEDLVLETAAVLSALDN